MQTGVLEHTMCDSVMEIRDRTGNKYTPNNLETFAEFLQRITLPWPLGCHTILVCLLGDLHYMDTIFLWDDQQYGYPQVEL